MEWIQHKVHDYDYDYDSVRGSILKTLTLKVYDKWEYIGCVEMDMSIDDDHIWKNLNHDL